MKTYEAENVVAILFGCCDLQGRDASYADAKSFKQKRHFAKAAHEGVYSSAHLLISLAARTDHPCNFPAVLEESEGLHRSRIERILTALLEEHCPLASKEAGPEHRKAKSSSVPRPRLRLDVHLDTDIRAQADKIRLKTINVIGDDPFDPSFFVEVERELRFRVESGSGRERAEAAIQAALEAAKPFLPKWKKVKMGVQRPDGHLVTVRAEAGTADLLAEAFQKIDQVTLGTPITRVPDRLEAGIIEAMLPPLKSRFVDGGGVGVHELHDENDSRDVADEPVSISS